MSRLHARSRVLLVSALSLALVVGLAACDRGSTDEQIAELEQELADTQAALSAAEDENAALEDEAAEAQGQLENSQTQLETTEAQLETTQAELETAQSRLARTENELSDTQAELLDAQLQLARVGELVLANGTFIGPILGAKTNPYRVIVFNAAGNFRAAQVAANATITSGGRERTLTQLARLLGSTNPDQMELANGNYQVIVRNGLVTSIRKSRS